MCCADSVVSNECQSWLKLLQKDIFGTKTGTDFGASHLVLDFIGGLDIDRILSQ